MNDLTVYTWEPSVSPHKLALFRALAAFPRVKRFVYVAQEEAPAGRAEQGWLQEDVSDLDIRIAPSHEEIARIFREAPQNAIHLFSGTHWVPCIVHGLQAAIRQRARFLIHTEPRAPEGFRGFLRYLHSWATEGRLRRHAAGVLAIGRNGPIWFKSTGYRPERIFPFAYFLPQSPYRPSDRGQEVRITYLGRLTELKGFRLFLASLRHLRIPAQVEVAGIGPDAVLAQSAQSDETLPPLRFHGTVPMAEVPQLLARTDVLVVPSIVKDGWAAVVTEALMAGAAVVATPKVGASICLDAPERGTLLHHLKPVALAEAITETARPDNLTEARRRERAEYAASRLSGDAGAAYLMAVLDHLFDRAPRPAPFHSADAAEIARWRAAAAGE